MGSFAVVVIAGTGCAIEQIGAQSSTINLAHPAPGISVVFDLDTTSSVSGEFRRRALDADADAVPRLIGRTGGAVRVYVNKLDRSGGLDEARVAHYVVGPVTSCAANVFDLACKTRRGKSLQVARAHAARVARAMKSLKFRVEDLGTCPACAFAAAGETLSPLQGERWLVASSDFMTVSPKGAAPTPQIRLRGVHVVLVYSCRDELAVCQVRYASWARRLRDAGAASVKIITVQDATLLFNPTLGG